MPAELGSLLRLSVKWWFLPTELSGSFYAPNVVTTDRRSGSFYDPNVVTTDRRSGSFHAPEYQTKTLDHPNTFDTAANTHC